MFPAVFLLPDNGDEWEPWDIACDKCPKGCMVAHFEEGLVVAGAFFEPVGEGEDFLFVDFGVFYGKALVIGNLQLDQEELLEFSKIIGRGCVG